MSGGIVGVDVGGTWTKIGLVGPDGRVSRLIRIATGADSSPMDFVRRVSEAVGGWRFRGLGLGLAGGVDEKTGALFFAPNLKPWVGFPFRRAFARVLRVPVVAENDANAAVWGGYVVALGKKPRHVIGLTLGTGVGGGLILDGRLYRGASRSAGEVGHQTLSPRGPLCPCGKRGCLEAYAGTSGIQRAARRWMRRVPRPLTPKAIADAAKAGDYGARRAWNEVGGWLGLGIANLALVYNPEAVLLLGGVAGAGRLILDPVERVLDAQPFRRPFSKLTLSAPGGGEWGCLGAAMLCREVPPPGGSDGAG